MIEKCWELLNTTDITLGMSILIAVTSAIIINLIFSCSKLIGKAFKYLYMKIVDVIKAIGLRIDYKKREKTGNLTTIEKLLKADLIDIEDTVDIKEI